MPLGQLSDKTVNEGYKILSELLEVHALITSGEEKYEDKLSEIISLTNQFYSTIPHVFEGRRKIEKFILSSSSKVKEKLDLIENLVNINHAVKI